jgi:carbamoyl-phosphate synthase small subunit
MKGYLVLENGRVFPGWLLNDCRMAGGEVVFTTAMISYQDIITDPSYYGQIVVMTYPLVGNVGLNQRSFASRQAMVKGLILREATDFPSHYEMETDLITFLNKSEIPVLTEVDTRALTLKVGTFLISRLITSFMGIAVSKISWISSRLRSRIPSRSFRLNFTA